MEDVITVSLTEDEITFLTAAWNDSASEGCFSPIWEKIQAIEPVFDSLVGKGVLRRLDVDFLPTSPLTIKGEGSPFVHGKVAEE
jgi:hypothetical protein